MSEDSKILCNFINKVRNSFSPEMYFGKVSLLYFQIYLTGFIQAQWDITGIHPDSIHEFTAYVGKYFNDSSNVGWANLILRHTKNEEEAFETFYRLFDEYVDSMNI